MHALVETFRQEHPECEVSRAQWLLRLKSGEFAVKARAAVALCS